MRIVVAPDKFKGSMTARAAGEAMARGLKRAFTAAQIDIVPVADGGDGTAEVLVDALGGKLETLDVQGPNGSIVRATFGLLPGDRAVIELARASGLALMVSGKNDPLTASTYGTGQLIAAAIDAGAKNVILGIGGSATNDGGAGALTALGAIFSDSTGRPLSPGGAALAELAAIDAAALASRLRGISIDIACDVANPLCGDNGASAGPLHEFGNGWRGNIFSAGQFIAFLHDARILDVDRLSIVDLWPELVVRDDSTAVWINTGGDGGAIHIRRGQVNRVMIAKIYTFPGQLPQRRRFVFAHKIRAHSVPDDYYDVTVRFGGLRRESCM